jgi:hypothetical protein
MSLIRNLFRGSWSTDGAIEAQPCSGLGGFVPDFHHFAEDLDTHKKSWNQVRIIIKVDRIRVRTRMEVIVKCRSRYTDKKENLIFLIYKEIQSGAVAKSYMRKSFLTNEEMRK